MPAIIDVVVVGFGFSAVPLLRELESTRTEFKIISAEDNTVWDGLSKSGRLDFDLVSSHLTSFYSFDLVERFEADYYPRATEYYEMHQRWRKVYEDRVVRDVVTKIDNFSDHSVLLTQSGKTMRARHVVVATGFRRAIHSDLATTDYNAPNTTFVFDTMGDSVNLMISHLIPHNARIIIRTNGFHARDKVVPAFGTTYTLDQLEFQNFRYVSHDHYASIIYGAPVGSGNPILFGDQFPVSVRDESRNTSKSRPVNGADTIKDWPIDEYRRKFGRYGFYTDDVARLIGIDHKPGDCTSVKDLMFYYAFPNNAFKYRLKGEDAVKGVDGLIEKANRQFDNFTFSFAYLLSSSIRDASPRTEWLLQVRRNVFNDMRHKERYRPFLESYIQAYRRLKNVRIADVEDREWDALVARACEVRDRAVPRIKMPSRFQADEDITDEMLRIQSWMNGGRVPGEVGTLKLGPRRAACLASMMDPPEYELPYLR